MPIVPTPVLGGEVSRRAGSDANVAVGDARRGVGKLDTAMGRHEVVRFNVSIAMACLGGIGRHEFTHTGGFGGLSVVDRSRKGCAATGPRRS
ncbi:MAG: hypothetical protein KGK18_15420, partial [Burkholderiales bacterium]|nr:hypothetical protein [Burkholderiales bacterium]